MLEFIILDMKMNNFISAIPDLNEVLEADPRNVKALFRRATCRSKIKMYREVKNLSTLCYITDTLSFRACYKREDLISQLTLLLTWSVVNDIINTR